MSDPVRTPTGSSAGPRPDRARRPARLTKPARAAAGLLVAAALVLIVEGVLRVVLSEVAEATIPSDIVATHVKNGGMKYDPDYGWVWAHTPIPNLGINTDGFRYGTTEVPKEKPAGVLRGFTLGDSQTYGAGLDWDETYTAEAERLLRAGGRNVELIGAATSGYGSLQVLRTLQDKLPAWHPDFVVVDCRTFDQPAETRAERHGDPLDPLRALLFESRIYYSLRMILREAGLEKGRRMNPRPNEPGMPSGEGNHQRIKDFVESRGMQIFFVDYPLWAGRDIVARAPAEELPDGAVVVPATAALIADGRQPNELFFDNNHLNEDGARIVGKVLAGVLDAHLPKP